MSTQATISIYSKIIDRTKGNHYPTKKELLDDLPTYERACTLKIYKKKLNIACAEHGIPLKHHDALSDAMGCAELYRRWVIGK